MSIHLLGAALLGDGGASLHRAVVSLTNNASNLTSAGGNDSVTSVWLDRETSDDEVNESAAVPHLVDRIHLIFVPLIILGGTVGNMLSLAVFRNTKLRRLSTSCYLTALSLSDTGFLLTLLTLWLEANNVPAFNQPVLCPLITYVAQVCSFLSPWLVVAFTVERFVATCYPLRRASVCTISRARVVVTGLTVVASMFYSYALVMAGHHGEPDGLVPPEGFDEHGAFEWAVEQERDVNGSIVGGAIGAAGWNATQYKCGVKPAYMDAMHALNWVDTVVTLIFPLVIIIVLNVLIARAVLRFERVRRRMTSMTSAGNNGCTQLPLPSSGGVGQHRGGDNDNNSATSSQDGSGRLYGSNASVMAASRLQQQQQQQVATPDVTPYSRRGVSYQHRSGSPVGAGGATTPTGLRKGTCHQRSVRGRYQIKITKMLLMISSVFLALNSPSYLARLWGFICGHSCMQGVLFYNVQQWSQLAFYLNFAVNFLLYCSSGQNFRKSLRHLVCKALSKAGHGGRHFSRKNTGNTTLSTAAAATTVTTIHNNGAPVGGLSAAAYRQLPLSAASSNSVKGGVASGRLEPRVKRSQTDTV